MDEAEKLREQAQAALRMAETTTSVDGRATLISLARIWLKRAERWDRQHESASARGLTCSTASLTRR